ncbi:class A beta-lactamase-related serine hydrolase [Weissella viridescens]|uniref:Class A beta-lactamase-related serine hydrolase n=1 Tax=Weissella viridescens TaxID=1629 RepID=A0A3P2RA43_WEIVI|nr:serine hydrolase domain-containing protein [Weissella viridescens]RRG17647.1 class A beta-lactamase-related serine hydrolase [Weissella viridescens]
MPLKKKSKWIIAIASIAGVCGVAYLGTTLVDHPTSTTSAPNKLSHQTKYEVAAQTSQAKHFESAIKQNKFSGTILVVKDGKTILNQGYGKTSIRSQRDNTTETKYPIASLTKNVTAVIAVKQLEAKGYSPETKLSTFYPDMQNAGNITIRQLITMNAKYETNKFTPVHLGNEQDYINEILKHTYYDHTKTTWHYNATDYHILIGVLQKVTGKTYEQLVSETFGDQSELQTLPGYTNNLGKPLGSTVEGVNVPFHKAAYQKELGTGDIFTNTWGIYQLLESEINHKIVSNDQFKAVSTPMSQYHEIYSGGLYSEDQNRAYFCRGVMQGFEDYVYMSKDGRDAVILQSNQYSVTGKNSNLAKYIYGKVVGHEVVFKNY